MSQLFFGDARAFGLRDRSRLAAHRLKDAEKAFVSNNAPVRDFGALQSG